MASTWPSGRLIAATSVGVAATSIFAYAVYWDHRRRTDPDFRKELKREARRAARAERSHAEAAAGAQQRAIREALQEAKDEGFPSDLEEKEAFFMEQVGQGEQLAVDPTKEIEAAICFFKALRVYPNPTDLMGIYDKTVPKPVLDILAEMIAQDNNIPINVRSGSRGSASSQHGVDD